MGKIRTGTAFIILSGLAVAISVFGVFKIQNAKREFAGIGDFDIHDKAEK